MRLRVRYVQAWVDRDGRVHHYFRRASYPRLRLPGLPGSTEFMAVYRAALDGARTEIGASKRSKAGSVSAAIASYYASTAFTKKLVPSSQGVRKDVLEAFRRDHGDKQIAALQRRHIQGLLDGMSPTAGRNWFKAIRALVEHCCDEGMLRENPTLGVKQHKIKSNGFHTWTEEELARFEARHAIGTRERLAFALGLYTGQRRGDVIRMGRQHIRDGMLHVTQEKTRKSLAIPILPELAAVLDAWPHDNLTFLTTLRGKQFDGHTFTAWFIKACAKAGLPRHCTFHGLRKAACRRLAEAGCTVHQIAAISGHVSLKEIERYTKAADQVRLAREAMARTDRARQNKPERKLSNRTGDFDNSAIFLSEIK